MKLFNFFKKKSKSLEQIHESLLRGKDFEFLIRGDLNIPDENWDQIMTPNSIVWEKVAENDWIYKVGDDEFGYSWELPGIQMVFNPEIKYEKAKKIVEEVIQNLKESGQKPELVELDNNKIYRFDLD
jgi:hypothetical protein